jgi:hypothetical protein
VHAFAAIGGVPRALVPDNLKAGITRPSRYEPGINRTYQELADHYDCVVLSARVRHPHDKAKVEVAVQIVERFVLASCAIERSFRLPTSMPRSVSAWLRSMPRLCGISAKVASRCCQELDRPALKPLPATPEIAGHFYSVPSRLIREVVEASASRSTKEIKKVCREHPRLGSVSLSYSQGAFRFERVD